MRLKNTPMRVKTLVIFMSIFLTHCEQGGKDITSNTKPEGAEISSSDDGIGPYEHLLLLKDSLKHIDGMILRETDLDKIASLENVQELFFNRFSEKAFSYKDEQDALFADALNLKDSLIDQEARQSAINAAQIEVNIYSVTVDKANKLVTFINGRTPLPIESSSTTRPTSESSEEGTEHTESSSLIPQSSERGDESTTHSETTESSHQAESSSQRGISSAEASSSTLSQGISSETMNLSSALHSSSSISTPTINSVPVFSPATPTHSIKTGVDTAYSFDLAAADVDGDPITWKVKSGNNPTHGTVSFASASTHNNTITYTPDSGYSGTDSFVLKIIDGNGGSSTMTIDVTILAKTAPPVPDLALTFDGDNDYVDLPPVDLDFSNGLTIECWIRFSTPRAYERIIEWGNGVTNDNVILLVDGANTKSLYFRVYHGTKGQSKVLANNILNGVSNTWTHIAMTLSNAGVVTFYKNGKKHNDVTGNPSAVPLEITRSSNFIGESNWSNDPEFKGAMDEFRIWKTVRSLSDIADAMDSRLTGTEQGLKHLWSFDDGSGTKVTDLVNSAGNGTTKNMSIGTAWISR